MELEKTELFYHTISTRRPTKWELYLSSLSPYLRHCDPIPPLPLSELNFPTPYSTHSSPQQLTENHKGFTFPPKPQLLGATQMTQKSLFSWMKTVVLMTWMGISTTCLSNMTLSGTPNHPGESFSSWVSLIFTDTSQFSLFVIAFLFFHCDSKVC